MLIKELINSKKQGVAEGFGPFDPDATLKAAKPLMDKLRQLTGAQVDYDYNKDGSIHIVLNRTDADPRKGWAPSKGTRVGDGELWHDNFDKAYTPFYNTFRQKGWYFSQPMYNAMDVGVPIQKENMAEGPAPEIDKDATRDYGAKIYKELADRFGANSIKWKTNSDGTNTLGKMDNVKWAEDVHRQYGKDRDPSWLEYHGVLTGKNFNAAVDPWYKQFRSKGWRFDQPVGGEFTIAVYKQQGVVEATVQHGKVYNNKGSLVGTWDGKTFILDPNREKSLIDTDGEEFVAHVKQMYQSKLSKQTAPAAPSKDRIKAPSEDRIKYYANELEKYDRQSGEPVKSRQEYYVLARDMLSHTQGVAEGSAPNLSVLANRVKSELVSGDLGKVITLAADIEDERFPFKYFANSVKNAQLTKDDNTYRDWIKSALNILNVFIRRVQKDMGSGMQQGVKEDMHEDDLHEVLDEIAEHLMEARSAARLLGMRFDNHWAEDKASSLQAHIAQAITMCEHLNEHISSEGEE